jgi:hypothetical protein
VLSLFHEANNGVHVPVFIFSLFLLFVIVFSLGLGEGTGVLARLRLPRLYASIECLLVAMPTLSFNRQWMAHERLRATRPY